MRQVSSNCNDYFQDSREFIPGHANAPSGPSDDASPTKDQHSKLKVVHFAAPPRAAGVRAGASAESAGSAPAKHADFHFIDLFCVPEKRSLNNPRVPAMLSYSHLLEFSIANVLNTFYLRESRSGSRLSSGILYNCLHRPS
jgi:hypothetical protein